MVEKHSPSQVIFEILVVVVALLVFTTVVAGAFTGASVFQFNFLKRFSFLKSTPTVTQNLAVGASCTSNSQCISEYCANGRCALKRIGRTCNADNQCLTSYCDIDSQGVRKCLPVRVDGLICEDDRQCSSKLCGISFSGARACLTSNIALGSACSDTRQCQSGTCVRGGYAKNSNKW